MRKYRAELTSVDHFNGTVTLSQGEGPDITLMKCNTDNLRVGQAVKVTVPHKGGIESIKPMNG